MIQDFVRLNANIRIKVYHRKEKIWASNITETILCSFQKKGFFGGLGAKLDKVGKDIGKGMDSAAASIEKTVDEKWKSALLVRGIL